MAAPAVPPATAAPPMAASSSSALSARLPEFPWDVLAPFAAIARAHPDGPVDLSIGTPVDGVPPVVREALAAAADAPAYPPTAGSPALRTALATWVVERCGATAGGFDVLPTVGSKELIAWLPTLLGLGAGDVVAHPVLAYPTYAVGARLAGAVARPVDGPAAAEGARLVWVNSPSNPTGRVLSAAELRAVVEAGRAAGALVVSDECYLELGWAARPVSVLDPAVCGDSARGVLAVHSLSKRSNLAGYRAGFVAGDPAVVAELLEVRRHAGMMVPAPVQAAMAAALGDADHVAVQRAAYAARRVALLAALEIAGFTVEPSEAGLYLWATRDEDCWESVRWLAGRGVLVAPGVFYGAAGARHVRVALTATDERVSAAVSRLTTP